MTTNIVDRAFEMALSEYGRAPRDGLAHPFGLADGDPRRWRVSDDVWRSLRAYVGEWVPDEPPPGARLLGLPLSIDEKLPPNSMLLERSDVRSAVNENGPR